MIDDFHRFRQSNSLETSVCSTTFEISRVTLFLSFSSLRDKYYLHDDFRDTKRGGEEGGWIFQGSKTRFVANKR